MMNNTMQKQGLKIIVCGAIAVGSFMLTVAVAHDGETTSRYQVRAVAAGQSPGDSKEVLPQKHQYFEIPLSPPPPFVMSDGKEIPYLPDEASVGDLDGELPSIVMGRGYYRGRGANNPGRTAIAAWDFRGGKLVKRWKFDTWQRKDLAGYIGQGTHSIAAGDVDGDGNDEILYGAMAINHDGTPLYTTRLGHGDAHHFGNLDPSRPGLEFFMPHESAGPGKIPGMSFRDARTGEILWSVPVIASADIGRGAMADIWAGSPGAEAWAAGGEKFWTTEHANKLFSSKGEVIGPAPNTPANFFVWWDGELTREILNKNWIAKYDPEAEDAMIRLLTAEGCTSINTTKATPVLSADLFGDWREEVIWPTEDGKAFRVYTTILPTAYRIPTLMHDPIYRLSIAWQNVAYNQPPA